MKRLSLAGLAWCFGLAASSPAQELIAELHGSSSGDEYGVSVASGGDVDGDGVNDLLVTTKSVDPTGNVVWAVEVLAGVDRALLRRHYGTGSVFFGASALFLDDVDGDAVSDYVLDGPDLVAATRSATLFSGATGAPIRTFALTASADDSAPRLLALADIDGDGIGDFAASDTGSAGGAVDVVSTGAGTVIFTVTGAIPQFAGDVATLPDRNGDGFDELAVTDEFQFAKNGVVWVYSGRTGVKLDEFDGQRGDTFADSVERMSDLDGDGRDELMVGALHATGTHARSGAVYVYSGGTHKVLFRVDGFAKGSGFGRALVDAGDVNGDGVHDIAVGAPFVYGGGYFGPAFLISGKTQGALYRFEFPATMNWTVNGLASLGDVNGDGLADLAVGDPESGTTPPGTGRLRLFGGNDLYLLATPRAPAANDFMSLVAREGSTTQLALTALVEVNGTPTFLPLALAPFDAFGALTLSDVVPPGLSGNSATFTAFAQRSPRGLRISAPEMVMFQ